MVPVHYVYDPESGSWTQRPTGDDLPLVYSNTALFVLPGGASSTSMPGVMTRMLESLDVHDGHDVLEIGTGTGYNAALLSHRLGDQHVASVDIETGLVDLAQARLARIGYQPTLVATDGAGGLLDRAPHDRIVGTCSVSSVPWPWIEQLRPTGKLLVDVKLGPLAGNLVLLCSDGERAEGRFDPTYASFMPMRHTEPGKPQPMRSDDDGPVRERSTALDIVRPWEHGIVWFLAHHALPEGTRFSLRSDETEGPPCHNVLSSPDGSWCEVRAAAEGGIRDVREAGRHRLWEIVEEAHDRWARLGKPGWERFGYTVTRSLQWVWLDRSDNPI